MRIGIWGLISRALQSVVPDLCSVLKGDRSHACAVGL